MYGAAFCPAHITGFFQPSRADTWEATGSVGAGFSITAGVTTTVRAKRNGGVRGQPIAKHVAKLLMEEAGENARGADITHSMGVPAGYGLGTSGALALSTAYALNEALEAGLDREALGRMAHQTDIQNKSGLGDVLAAYHGGFEVRTRAGAPGYGNVVNMDAGDPDVFVVCISPLSTGEHIGRVGDAGGLGGRMVADMLKNGDIRRFQSMSMEFARGCGLVTPAIEDVERELRGAGCGCGVALFGQTVFAIAPRNNRKRVSAVLGRYPNTISTGVDTLGARVLK